MSYRPIVFISSSVEDLKEYREQAAKAAELSTQLDTAKADAKSKLDAAGYKKGSDGLRKLPDQADACFPAGHEGGMKRLVLRQRRNPELDLRDGAYPPFAAQDQLAQVRPGSRSRHIRYGHRAVRRLDARAREHLLDAPVA